MESPVKFNVAYPEKLSQGMLLVKLFFGWLYLIPHFILFVVFIYASSLVLLIGWLNILFSGKFPKGHFDSILNVIRFWYRVFFYWGHFMTDQFPSYKREEFIENNDFLTLNIVYPESLDPMNFSIKFWVGQILIIPHIFCLFFYYIWVIIAKICAWWAVLFTGHYPKIFFNAIVNFERWCLRVMAYYPLMMSDVYPPFNGREE
jgi:hypothetical protein